MHILDQVGLKHSTLMGSGVILKGGMGPAKALKVTAFAEKVTDEGFIGRDTMERGMLDCLRALLAQATVVPAARTPVLTAGGFPCGSRTRDGEG